MAEVNVTPDYLIFLRGVISYPLKISCQVNKPPLYNKIEIFALRVAIPCARALVSLPLFLVILVAEAIPHQSPIWF